MCTTLQESDIEVKAKVRALHGNNPTEAGIKKMIQKRTVKGTEKERDIMTCKMKGGERGSETVGKRVEAEKEMTMTEIEVGIGIGIAEGE